MQLVVVLSKESWDSLCMSISPLLSPCILYRKPLPRPRLSVIANTTNGTNDNGKPFVSNVTIIFAHNISLELTGRLLALLKAERSAKFH